MLAGGGALGAYQIGCLKVLQDKGIEFEAVAGTSVGALNAALWSFNRLDEGEKFWQELTYSDVYPPKYALLKRLPPRFYYRLMFVQIVLSLLSGALKRSPFISDFQHLRFVFVNVNALLVAAYTGFLLSSVDDANSSMLTTSVLGFGFAYIMLMLIQIPSGNRDAGVPSFYLGMVGLHSTILFLLSDKDILTIWLAIGFGVSLYLLYQADRYSFLSSSPLARNINKILRGESANVPTFVVSAIRKSIYDPISCRFDRRTPNIGPMGVDLSNAPTEFHASTEKRWVPIYSELSSKKPRRNMEAALLASAALPFGIVEPVYFEEEMLVDGGVCDNEPILPLLDRELDEIWVLCVHPQPKEQQNEYLKELQTIVARNQRNQLLAKLPIPSSIFCKRSELHALKKSQTDITAYDAVPEEAEMLPSLPKIKILAPEKELAENLLTGLLRFEGAFCKELINQGETDARSFLKL